MAAALRREGLRHIAEQREIDRISRVDRERAERRDLRSANKVPSWQSWLEDEALKANPDLTTKNTFAANASLAAGPHAASAPQADRGDRPTDTDNETANT